jgi:membrane-associated phospholipid phosphatase
MVTLAWMLAGPLGWLFATGPVTGTDQAIAFALRDAAAPMMVETLSWLSRVHGTAGILAMSAFLAAWLASRGKNAVLPVLAASVPGGLILNVATKHAVERARPDWPHVAERLASFSFPSGHTAGATVLYGCLVALLWPMCRAPLRVALVASAVVLIALVATSRVLLGVHYPSDCAAAVLEGLLWLAFCLMSARVLRA